MDDEATTNKELKPINIDVVIIEITRGRVLTTLESNKRQKKLCFTNL